MKQLDASNRSIRRTVGVVVAWCALATFAGCATTPGQQSLTEFVGDASRTSQVQRRLAQTASTAQLPITVDTIGGVVVLRGRVANAAQRRQAEQVARSTPGVQAVQNEIVVQP